MGVRFFPVTPECFDLEIKPLIERSSLGKGRPPE